MSKVEEKTHWKKNFNYDYMGAYSLPDGKDVVVTIKELKKEKVKGAKGKKEDCVVCYFIDSDKPMILNKTNCRTIEKLYGTPFVEDWGGKKIQLYSAKVDAFGDVTDALRVRDFKPTTTEDNSEAISKLNACESLEQLRDTYSSLPKNMQADKEVIKLKDKLKSTLQ
jgi:hypothetical protein